MLLCREQSSGVGSRNVATLSHFPFSFLQLFSYLLVLAKLCWGGWMDHFVPASFFKWKCSLPELFIVFVFVFVKVFASAFVFMGLIIPEFWNTLGELGHFVLASFRSCLCLYTYLCLSEWVRNKRNFEQDGGMGPLCRGVAENWQFWQMGRYMGGGGQGCRESGVKENILEIWWKYLQSYNQLQNLFLLSITIDKWS